MRSSKVASTTEVKLPLGAISGITHLAELAEAEVNEFLSHLAIKENVSASTENQALSALFFLYRYVLDRQLGEPGKVIRARKSSRLPVVLTREEVKAVLSRLKGEHWLIATLMYGTGMCLMERLRLRVKDIDFGSNQITIAWGRAIVSRHDYSKALQREKVPDKEGN